MSSLPASARADESAATSLDGADPVGAADSLGAADDEASAQLSLISLPTAASIAGVLALVAAWLAVIAVGGGLWLPGASPLGSAQQVAGASPAVTGWVSSQAVVLALALAASLTFLSVVLAMIVTWVRPLRSLVRATTLLIQGQWHRPIPQSIAAIAPVQQLAVLYEDLRGSLVERLRSSTELNLQLESEVARRTAELERRNSELAALLVRLESTRSEILRNEKLATVGRVASDVASSIREPMDVLLSVPPRIVNGFDHLVAIGQPTAASAVEKPADSTHPAGGPIAAPVATSSDGAAAIASTLADMDAWLGSVVDSASRVSHVVRALRVYARPDSRPSLHSPIEPEEAPLAQPAQTIDDEKADPSPTRLPPARFPQ